MIYMNIAKTLKHNKIKKISLAKSMGLSSTNALKYNIAKKPAHVENCLILMLVEKAGVNLKELIKEKIIS